MRDAGVKAPICFVDTETDGVHPGRKAWEIAIIRREEGSADVEWSAFVDIDLSTADPFGLSVGRFYERHPAGRLLSSVDLAEMDPADRSRIFEEGVLTGRQAAYEVARRTHGAHIVGAVPNFDTEVLAALLRQHGLTPAWHYHLIDVENLAVGRLAALGVAPDLPWSSDELSDLLGVGGFDPAERHTALGDARWASAIYERTVGRWSVPAMDQPRPLPTLVVKRTRELLYAQLESDEVMPPSIARGLHVAMTEAAATDRWIRDAEVERQDPQEGEDG